MAERSKGKPRIAITANGITYDCATTFYKHLNQKYGASIHTASSEWRRKLGPDYTAIEQKAKELYERRQAKNTRA